jgi:ribosomal protein L31E
MFRLMEPLHHDADPNRSQVLAHIMENMRCDMGRAIRAFNSMRHPKSKVLVFDAIHRMWKGCDWVPADNDSKDSMFIVELRTLQRRVVAMDSELKKAVKEIKRLNKKLANAKEMENTPEINEDWFAKMREALGTNDEKPMNTTESLVAQAWS